MAAYLENLYADLRAAMAAQWTDVVADGIWEAENLEKIPWDNVTPPFGVIILGAPEIEDDLTSGDSIVFRVTPSLAWVGSATGDSSAQRGKIEGLRDYLLTNDLPNSRVIDIQMMDWTSKNETNQFFINKNYDHRAGVLIPVILVGESWGT